MHLARALRLLILSVALIGPARLSAAPVDDARAALVSGIDEVSAALRGQTEQADLVAKLDTLADKHFAFTTTTRLAVGRDWRDFSPADQARATELFSRLVVRTYSERIRGTEEPKVAYGAPTELNATRVEIPTTITASGNVYSVIYRMELDREAARWRVYDVVAEGVSLISNYRAQFAPIVAKSGAAGLIRSLEAKLAEPAAPSAK